MQSGLGLAEVRIPAGLEVSLAAEGTCGAYVRGVDLADEPGGEVVYCLRTLADHAGFLVIRNQAHLTEERLAEVVHWFGAAFVPSPARAGLPARRGVVNVMSREGGPTGHLAVFPHTDNQPQPVVPDFTLLLAVDIPPPEAGPITWFADLFRAFEDLDPHLKRRVEHARQRPYTQAVANYRCFEQIRLDMDRDGFTPRGDEVCEVLHPVVRTHPVSGRRALWVSRMTEEIVEESEGRALAEQLAAHVEQEHHFTGHRWEPGDLLIFDNRAVVHKRDPCDPAYPRVMWGAQAGGARPF